MSFLNPFLLLGLLAIAIPLVIHLIQLRKPKKVRFSTLAFFQSLQKSTLRHIRLKQWLLLALRTLALILLALALARPYLPSGVGLVPGQDQPASIGILIDNSPSMDQVDQFGPYINQVKRIAGEIIGQGGSEDRFFLEVTNGAPLELPGMSGSGARTRLDGIESENLGNFTESNLRNLIYRLVQSPQPVRQLYLLTDGQATQFSEFTERAEELFDGMVQVITVGDSPQPNSAITSVDLENYGFGDGGPGRLRVMIRNFGESPLQNHFLSLEQDQQIVGQHAVELQPGEEESYFLEPLPGEGSTIHGRLVLEGGELTFDNIRYVAVRRPELRRVLLAGSGTSSSAGFQSYTQAVLEAAFEENASIEWVSGTLDQFSDPDGWDAVILDGVQQLPDYLQDEIVRFVQEGGGLFFIPSSGGDLNSYNRMLERLAAGSYMGITGSYGSFQGVTRLSSLREGHPILDGIFESVEGGDLRVNLPEIYYFYPFEEEQSGISIPILSTTSGYPILLERQVGQGRILISSIGADPGWSNLPVMPIFAPLFYRSVLYLAMGDEETLDEHILGEEFIRYIPGQPGEIVIEAGEQRIIPERQVTRQGTRIRYDAQDWTPGMLTLIVDDRTSLIALNQNTMESDFRTLTAQELEQLLTPSFVNLSVRSLSVSGGEVADVVQTGRFGIEIWYWFVLFAMGVLIAETVVSRHYRAESNFG